ncbi:ornithine cyclodeaminase [compost metagenome]
MVDQREAALEESGELIDAIGRGIIKPERLIELGEIANGAVRGRTSPDQITVFKSVGLAVQDVVAGTAALKS